MPLQLTQRLEPLRGEADLAKVLVKGGDGMAIKAEGMVAFAARGREVQLAQR